MDNIGGAICIAPPFLLKNPFFLATIKKYNYGL